MPYMKRLIFVLVLVAGCAPDETSRWEAHVKQAGRFKVITEPTILGLQQVVACTALLDTSTNRQYMICNSFSGGLTMYELNPSYTATGGGK